MRVHVETREVPVLELVVASGGAKGLKPFMPGACVPWEWNVFPPRPLDSGQRWCTAASTRADDGRYLQTVEAQTLDDWAAGLGRRLGRPIVNKTGITGLQTFRFVYSGSSEDYPVEIKEQLGLELRPSRGPRRFLVLDRVVRPRPGDTESVPRRSQD